MRWTLLVLVLIAGCTTKESKAGKDGCDLSGHYRLRFEAGVGQKLWFRFKVDNNGRDAVLTPPMAMAVDKTNVKLKLDPDPAACKLSVIATTERGDLLASMTVDPRTNAVTGTLRPAGARSSVPLAGVRDLGPPTGKSASCVTPGVYELVIPTEQAWESTDDAQSCDEAIVRIPFLVEPFGEHLSIDQLDADGRTAWGAEDIYEVAPCQVEVRFRHHDRQAYAILAFSGDKVTAEATHATVKMVGKSGDVWQCEIRNPMAWVERKPQ